MSSNIKHGAASKKRALSYKSIKMSHVEEEDSDQALIDQILKICGGTQEMLSLLSAYDEVIKNKVPQAQATRIYRQLLKMNREQQDFTFVNEQHVRTVDTLDAAHTTQESQENLDHFRSVGSISTNLKSLKRYSSQQEIKKPKSKSKPKKVVAKKPPKQESQLSLPKLSFQDLLNRAPKPMQKVPKPHAPLIYVEQESDIGSVVDSRNGGLKGLKKMLLASNSSEVLLKPDITHFTNDKLLSKLIDEDSMLILDESEGFRPNNDCLRVPKISQQHPSLTYQNSTINSVAPSNLISHRSHNKVLRASTDMSQTKELPSFHMDSYDSRSDSLKVLQNNNVDLQLTEQKIQRHSTSKEEINQLVNIMVGPQNKRASKADLLEKQLEKECQQLDQKLLNQKITVVKPIKIEQDLRRAHLADHFYHKKLKSKTICSLVELPREKLKFKLAFLHHSRKIKREIFHNFQYYTKIILPEERAMAVALKQHQILLKIQVFRELLNYRQKRVEKSLKFQKNCLALEISKKYKLFNLIVNFAAKSAIKRSLLQRSIEQRRLFLMRTGLHSLRIYRGYSQSMTQIYERTKSYYYTQLQKKSWVVLMSFTENQKRQRQLETIGQYLVQQKTPGIKQSVFIALYKFGQNQKNNKKAEANHACKLYRKVICGLKQAVVISQNYNNQKAISIEIYKQRIIQNSFESLQGNVKIQKQQNMQFIKEFTKKRLRVCFQAFSKVTRSLCILQPMGHKGQLKCSRLILSYSFEKLMQEVWQEFPDQKWIGTILPNYLKVSKSRKYKQFYIKVNGYILEDLKETAFKSLQANVKLIKSFRKSNQLKQQMKYFKAFRTAAMSQKLIQKYLQRSEQLRRVKFLKQVFIYFRFQLQSQIRNRFNFKHLQQSQNRKIISGVLSTWTKKWRKAQQRAYLENISAKFYRHRIINKFLSSWIKNLSLKLKKNHLKNVVFPKAQKIFISHFFKSWRYVFMKNFYLEKQLNSIEQYQKDDLVEKAFLKLKKQRERSIEQKTMFSYANQQYLYNLGKRVIQQLKINSLVKIDKKVLYDNVIFDHHNKVICKCFNSIRNYVQIKAEQRINDVFTRKNLETKLTHKMFAKWRNKFYKISSLRFLALNLDVTRVRLSLESLKNYKHFLDTNQQEIINNKNRHVLNQWFLQLKKHLEKKRILTQLKGQVQNSYEETIIKRYYKTWRRKNAVRDRNLQAFQWTFMQVRKAILKNYFTDFKMYARYKQLKKKAPQIYLENLQQKSFYKLINHQVKIKNCIQANRILKQKTENRIRHLILKVWAFRSQQSILLRKGLYYYNFNKKSQIFQSIKYFSIRNKVFQAQSQKLQIFRKKQAVKKLVAMSKRCAELDDKILVAECFNNQYMYQQSFKAWVRHSRRPQIKLAVQLRSNNKVSIQRQFLSKWIEASWRPLQKFDAVRIMAEISRKNEVKDYFQTWQGAFYHDKNQEYTAYEFECRRLTRLAGQALHSLKCYRVQQRNKKESRSQIDSYYARKTQFKVIMGLQWYAETRVEKNEMISIAKSHNAEKVTRRTFIIFRYICDQMRVLREAREDLEFDRKIRALPRVIRALKLNIARSQANKVLEQRAGIFRSLKSYERVFKGLFGYCVHQAQKAINLEKASQHYVLSLQRSTLSAIRNFSDESRILTQKRHMLFQVIQMIDHQNRLQTAYDSMFQHLIRSHDDAHYIKERLKFQKMKRIFRIFEWNRDNHQQFKAAHDLIACKNQSSQKYKFFFQWRSRLIKHQIVGAFIKNREATKMIKIMEYLSYYSDRNLKVKKCLHLKKQLSLEINFGRLRQFTALRQIKKAQLALAVTHFDKSLTHKSFGILKQYLEKENFVRARLEDLGKRAMYEGFLAWNKLFQRKSGQKELLIGIIQRKEMQEKSHFFKKWKYVMGFMRLLKTFYQIFGLEKIYTEEYLKEIQVVAFKNLHIMTQRRKSLRQKQADLTSKSKFNSQKRIFSNWKNLLKERFMGLKLKSILQPRIQGYFDEICSFSEKQTLLLQLEEELRRECALKLKTSIMVKWALLIEKRENLTMFRTKKRVQVFQTIFQKLKQNVKKSQQKKQQEMLIIDHFGNSRPQNLQQFQKFFLILSYQQMVEAENIRAQQNQLIKMSFSGCSGLELQSYTEDLGVYYTGVNICSTSLAKYIFDKWKLSLPSLRQNNQKRAVADEFYGQNLFLKVFQEWSDRTQIKKKERQIIMFGKEFFDECLVKKAFGVLNRYKEKRQNVKQLKSIGNELLLIKQTQHLHKSLVLWYDLTVEQVQSEQRYDQIISNFQLVQLEKKIPQIFYAFKHFVIQNQEMARIQQDMYHYAAQFYHRSLLKKVLRHLKHQQAEEDQQSKVSKLIPIFQAWKFYVKENSLLKKYLAESNQNSKFMESEDALKLSFMNKQ